MLAKLKSLFTVLKKGEAVADAARVKNWQAVLNGVTALIVAGIAAANQFGYEVNVAPDQIERLLAHLGGLIVGAGNIWATLATSKKVGIGGEPTE